jgi:ribulose-phosphate 3-epimerase
MVGLNPVVANLTGLLAGIYFAYWMNVRFNFKVPIAKRNRALVYFCVISAGSAAINFACKKQLQSLGWTYENARFAVAGTFFLLAYMFHRRFSFADFKKVGVAIYANGIEDIGGIYRKIGAFPDFIHVDVIDDTFGDSKEDPKAYRLETIQAYWPRKPVHIHLMSRRPTRWIREVAPYVNTLFIHMEIDDNVSEVLALIRSLHKKAGVCQTMATPAENLKPLIGELDAVMLLTIASPGLSGQEFCMSALDKIGEINRWEERSGFSLCIDGGVNERNIGLLNVESVVSGSSVLNSASPSRQIMRLQTSSSYERV